MLKRCARRDKDSRTSLGDALSLCDQLTSIELGDDGFQDLVDDGRQDALVVVLSEGSVYLGEVRDIGSGQYSAAYVHLVDVRSMCRLPCVY